MALLGLRPPHALGPSLTVSRSTSRATSRSPRRLLDQALLRRAEILGPIGGQREGVEAELRIERRSLVGEQPLQMLRLAARDGRRDARERDAAVDPEPGAATAAARRDAAPASCAHELGDQPLERLGRRFGMSRRLLQPKRCARRRIGRRRRSAARPCARASGRARRPRLPRPGTAAPAPAAARRSARRWS